MVKPTQGFVTKFGRFFEDQQSAELNEAEEELVQVLEKNGGEVWPDTETTIQYFKINAKPIHRYLTIVLRGSVSATKTSKQAPHALPQASTPRERNARRKQQEAKQEERKRQLVIPDAGVVDGIDLDALFEQTDTDENRDQQ